MSWEWDHFDPVVYTKETWAEHVRMIKLDWHPIGVTLHNTYRPTLVEWTELGPEHDKRIKYLRHLYEDLDHWHAGPHAFISRNHINGFSPLGRPGVHCSCDNAIRFGFECAGDYESESWDKGDGALVRDMAVWAVACVYKKIGGDPTNLKFHRDCYQDHHPCPGKNVAKIDFIDRVLATLASVVMA